MKGYSYPGASPMRSDLFKRVIDKYNKKKAKREASNQRLIDAGYVLASDANNPGKNQRWIHKSKLED